MGNDERVVKGNFEKGSEVEGEVGRGKRSRGNKWKGSVRKEWKKVLESMGN